MKRSGGGVAPVRWLESLWLDVLSGVRSLLRSPGITAAALLALALGIGANTALFSVASATLWRDLPFRDPDRLVLVWQSSAQSRRETSPVPPFLLDVWQRRNRTFTALAGQSHTWANLTAPGKPELIDVSVVAAGYFAVAGVELVAGRDFRPEEARDKGRVVILSDRLFRERFGGDPRRLKEGIALNGERFAVVGVAPPRAAVIGDWDVWRPWFFDREERGRSFVRVLGRLAPGVTAEQARMDLAAITVDLGRKDPAHFAGTEVSLQPLRTDRQVEIRKALLVLGLLVSFVLLIACADVAGLLLARATAREREIALRALLGADRARLVRRMLVESVLLFLAGGGLGLLLAFWGTPALAALSPRPLADGEAIGPDGRALLFTLAVSLGTGLLFGLGPALWVTGRRLSSSLQEGRSLAGQPGGRLIRDAVIAGQVTLTLLLAVAASLLLQSFDRLRQVDPGFEPRGGLAAKIHFPSQVFADPATRVARTQRLLESVRKVPGVRSAALVDWLPFDADTYLVRFAVEGRPAPPPSQAPLLTLRTVTPGYFRTIGIPLVKGRLFNQEDRAGSLPVLIVNEALASRYWPGRNPIGKRLGFRISGPRPEWLTVIGVVGNTQQDGLAVATWPEAYRPIAQNSSPYTALVVRAPGRPEQWERPIRQAVWKVEPGLGVGPLRSLEGLLEEHLAADRFKSLLAGLFALLAVFLATVGIYGVVSHSVARRTHEIGIRVALGAEPGHVLRRVILEGMAPVLFGTGVGLIAAWPLGRLLDGQLYGVRADDPLTFTVATLAILLVGLVANYFPADRATRVDPMAALRED